MKKLLLTAAVATALFSCKNPATKENVSTEEKAPAI